MRGVTILYEDSAGERVEFSLHDLVVRCVADRIDGDVRALRSVLHGIPKKGNGNVWRACRQDLSRLARGGRAVIAVFDDDRVRTMAGLPSSACKSQVAARIKTGCEPASQLRVALLVENTETLLVALRDLGIVRDRDAMFADAIDRKILASRDILFKDAVWRTTPEQRAALIEKVPSFGYLVSKLAALLSPDPS